MATGGLVSARLYNDLIKDEPNLPVPHAGTVSGEIRPASLAEFALWLLNAGEREAISCAHLRALYAEFGLYSETPTLSEGRMFRALKAAGILRYRQGTGARRWLYRVSGARGGGAFGRPERVASSLNTFTARSSHAIDRAVR